MPRTTTTAIIFAAALTAAAPANAGIFASIGNFLSGLRAPAPSGGYTGQAALDQRLFRGEIDLAEHERLSAARGARIRASFGAQVEGGRTYYGSDRSIRSRRW